MQLELFGRQRPDAKAKLIDWEAVSGMDLASDEKLLRRYIRERQPHDQAQMRRWAENVKERKRARWRAERAALDFPSGIS